MTSAANWGLLHNQPLLHARAQAFVSGGLNTQEASDAMFAFVALGVSNSDIERLLVNMRIHGQLVDAWLEVAAQEKAGVERARAEIERIRRLLHDIDSRAAMLICNDIPDGREVPIAVFLSADIVRLYFEDYQIEAAKTRARLGIVSERIRAKAAAHRAAIGRFAYLMRELTPGRQAHPVMVVHAHHHQPRRGARLSS
jgi:hypothetical protein